MKFQSPKFKIALKLVEAKKEPPLCPFLRNILNSNFSSPLKNGGDEQRLRRRDLRDGGARRGGPPELQRRLLHQRARPFRHIGGADAGTATEQEQCAQLYNLGHFTGVQGDPSPRSPHSVDVTWSWSFPWLLQLAMAQADKGNSQNNADRKKESRGWVTLYTVF